MMPFFWEFSDWLCSDLTISVWPTTDAPFLLLATLLTNCTSHLPHAGLPWQLVPAKMHTAAAATDIVSVSGRYPGSAVDAGIAGFWQALQAEQDLPSTVPLQRWDVDKYFSPETKSRQLSMYVRMAAFVDELDHFDASLFRCHSALSSTILSLHRTASCQAE